MTTRQLVKVVTQRKRTKWYPLTSPSERLLLWERARGMWKDRKPDPLKVLKRMRKEWERQLA